MMAETGIFLNETMAIRRGRNLAVANDPRNRIPDKGEKAVPGLMGGDP